MRQFTVLVELRLNRLLVLFAIRPMPSTLCSNRERGTRRATGLYRNISEPLCNADGWLFHLRLGSFDFAALGSLALRTNESLR